MPVLENSFCKQDVGAALACDCNVTFVVSIEISRNDLQATSNMPLFDGVACEFLCLGIPVVVIQAGHFLATGIITVVAVVAFACDQFRITIAIDVRPRLGVWLAKTPINLMLFPLDFSVGINTLVLPPKQAIIVPFAKNQITVPILIQIGNDHWNAGM